MVCYPREVTSGYLVHVWRNHVAPDRASAANGINETTKRARELALIAPRAATWSLATRRRRSRPEVGGMLASFHRAASSGYHG